MGLAGDPASVTTAAVDRRQAERFRRLLVTVAVVGTALGSFVRLARGGPNEWLFADYGVSYASHGFIRRGLLGTVVSPVVDDRSDVVVALAVVTVVGALVVAVLLLRVGARVDDERQRGTVLVVAAAVFSQLGWRFGAPDVVVVAVLLGVWLELDEWRDRSVVRVTLLLVVGGLVHEMVLLWGGALLVGAVWSGRVRPAAAAVPVTASALLGGLLLTVGRYEGSAAALVEAIPFPVRTTGLLVERADPWVGSAADGVEDVLGWAGTIDPVELLVLPIAVLACGVVLWRRVGWAVALATVAPALALAAVAIDHHRWAFFVLAVTSLQLLLVRALPGLDDDRVVPTVVFVLVIGAVGDAHAFPYWNALLPTLLG